MRRTFGLATLLGLASCPKPPPPPSTTEVPRLVAEESCTTPTQLPALPPRPAPDPFRLTHPAEMDMIVDGKSTPIMFLCDLPDQILGIGATQTVDGGKRVVGGTIYIAPRIADRKLPSQLVIEAASPGCKQGELACVFQTEAPTMTKIDMLRDQWINTSGWVHGIDDMCRALPDDTIAVCSTRSRMAYVELGCNGALHLGIHDNSMSRVFDLDVESPVMRMRGALDPANAATWTFRFTGDPTSVAPTGAPPKKPPPGKATLAIEMQSKAATLDIDGAVEPCIAWAIYRR